jgi:hypothetical protein
MEKRNCPAEPVPSASTAAVPMWKPVSLNVVMPSRFSAFHSKADSEVHRFDYVITRSGDAGRKICRYKIAGRSPRLGSTGADSRTDRLCRPAE